MDAIEELLTRRVAAVYPSKEALDQVLRSGKKIRLYQGFDPSSPNLHLGHLVGLLQLKAFQDLGHEVIFLIGNFTGMIGDPTDKTAARPKLTHDEIMKNAQTYKDQASKILDFSGSNPVQIRFNYDWLSQINFTDLIEITSHLTVQQLIERDMFQARLKQNAPIYLHEFLYPVAQGYDSVFMDVDLEVGGNDQMFNLMIGRQLLKALKGKDKFCLTTKLLTDAEGRKIGKTTGNAINLLGSANDLYGAIMSQPDSLLDQGFHLATTLPLNQCLSLSQQAQTDPLTAKKSLAFEVTQLCQGQAAAQTAQTYFEATIQNKQTPSDIKIINLSPKPLSLLDLISACEVEESHSQIKRVIEQGGVIYNHQKLTNPQELISPLQSAILKYGKRQYYQIQTQPQ